jgi:hypothetical protein
VVETLPVGDILALAGVTVTGVVTALALPPFAGHPDPAVGPRRARRPRPTVTDGYGDLRRGADPTTLRPVPLVIAAVTDLLVIAASWPVPRVLGPCAAVGLLAGICTI